MQRRFFFFGALALASASAVVAQARTDAPATPSSAGIDNSTQTEDVRFKTDVSERMTVPVVISGTGPYHFLVDTGSNRTAISRQVASGLRLVSAENATVHSVAGRATVSTATVPSLRLTRKEIRNINAPLLEGVNMGADGILGTDSLRSQRVLFDFDAQTLSIVPSVLPDFKAEPGTIVIQGMRRNGRLILTEATANGRRLTVVIDTGSQVSVGNSALRKLLLGDKVLSGSQQVELLSVTGQKISGDHMFVRELNMGGVGLKGLAIVFAEAHTFKQLKLDRKPTLLLGMNAMRAFRKVSIDFGSRKIRVVVPEHSSLDMRMAARIR